MCRLWVSLLLLRVIFFSVLIGKQQASCSPQQSSNRPVYPSLHGRYSRAAIRHNHGTLRLNRKHLSNVVNVSSSEPNKQLDIMQGDQGLQLGSRNIEVLSNSDSVSSKTKINDLSTSYLDVVNKNSSNIASQSIPGPKVKVPVINPAQMNGCSSPCGQDIPLRKIFRIEQIKEKILKETGLTSPPNMSGIVIPRNPSLDQEIEDVYSEMRRTVSIGGDGLYNSADGLSNDDPTVKTEKAFFTATQGFPHFKIPDGSTLIFFEFGNEHATDIYEAMLHIWLEPITIEWDDSQNQNRKMSRNNQQSWSHLDPQTGLKDLPHTMGRDDRPQAQRKRLGNKSQKKKRHKMNKSKKGINSHAARKAKSKPAHQALPELILTFLQVNKSPPNQMAKTKFIKSQSVAYDPAKGGWASASLFSEVRYWLSNPDMNFGLIVSARTKQGTSVPITGDTQSANVPTMEVDLVRDFSERRKRFANNRICTDDRVGIETVCCRYPLIVNFVELGWDFIVAPKKYEANYCRGECPFLYAHKYPHSTLIQTRFNNISHKKFNIGPCCGARELDPLKMIYYDRLRYKVATIRDMVVKSCGCT